MTDVSLGVVMMNRTEKLSRLLESANQQWIDEVCIADAGEQSPAKQRIYDKSYSFETEVLDLKTGIELGRSRKRIVDEFSGDYLLTVDSDHTVPNNAKLLVDQISDRSDVGGIAGSIVEPKKGRIWQSAKDFYEDGDTLVRDARYKTKTIECISGSPFVEFDFIPSAGIFRRECLEDYSWDPKYTNSREHADLYVGHWKDTDWRFGISPEVLFGHYPGGDSAYVSNRFDKQRKRFSEEYFLDKWGYESFEMGEPYWFDTHTSTGTIFERIFDIYQSDGVGPLVYKGYEKTRRLLGKHILS